MMGAWPAFARGFVSRAVRASWLATIGEVWVIRWSYFTVPGVDSAPVGFRWQCCTSLRVTVHGINPLSVLHLVRRGDPGGEARPGFIAEQLRGGESARGRVFAQFIVEKGVVKAGAGGVGGAAVAYDDGAKRTARAVEHILGGQRDGAAQKLGICR